nr:zinc finger transcription factor ace1 [Quercus suber]
MSRAHVCRQLGRKPPYWTMANHVVRIISSERGGERGHGSAGRMDLVSGAGQRLQACGGIRWPDAGLAEARVPWRSLAISWRTKRWSARIDENTKMRTSAMLEMRRGPPPIYCIALEREQTSSCTGVVVGDIETPGRCATSPSAPRFPLGVAATARPCLLLLSQHHSGCEGCLAGLLSTLAGPLLPAATPASRLPSHICQTLSALLCLRPPVALTPRPPTAGSVLTPLWAPNLDPGTRSRSRQSSRSSPPDPVPPHTFSSIDPADMSSPAAHPRRRPARAPSPTMTPSLIDSFQNMSIRKGDTFHNPSTADPLWDPLESSVTNPAQTARATTCPKSLEDLLIGAGERRAAELLARVDKAIETNSKLALSSVLTDPDVLPTPSLGSIPETSADEDSTVRKAGLRTRRHSHSSDSGLGASVAGTTESAEDKVVEDIGQYTHGCAGHDARANLGQDSDSSSTIGGRSFSQISAASDEERGLSDYAIKQIKIHIVDPILREPRLQEFHPLISGVPERIGNKKIKNLRELEKTLIFLAPVSPGCRSDWIAHLLMGVFGVKEYSRSPSTYLRFCERTIRVLHTTVTTLHESDQKASADRPYTQGYFFELVEQVRSLSMDFLVGVKRSDIDIAHRFGVTPPFSPSLVRSKPRAKSSTKWITLRRDESVSVLGGMTHNGKPAELVRHKDGKVISIATGLAISPDDLASSSMKRPMSDAEYDEDDDVLRSMARRKKNAKPEIHACSISGCDKEFKRPCDLTKHIKTHERPWKCPEEQCKYHDHGWPTEKERDRHVNDKHSTAPSLYHCLFPPCPYTSKRESNCKQHMEKAHGWDYIRSKNNGKGKAVATTRLPQGSIPPSPSSTLLTPLTPIAPSPSIQSWSDASHRSSMPPPGVAGPSTYSTPSFTHPSPDFAGHFNMDFDFSNMDHGFNAGFPITPAMSEDRRASSAGCSSHSGFQADGSAFDDGLSPHQLNLDSYNFNDYSNFQQPTPDSSAVPGSGHLSVSHASHASPGAQLNQTFNGNFYDDMNIDGAFGDGYDGPNEDFQLFGGNPSGAAPTTPGEMFPATGSDSQGWNNFGGQFPQMKSANSTLDDLFPELKNH